MPITDTSWLYAFINDLDAHHNQAIADAQAANSLVVPSLVLAETLQLAYFRSRQEHGETQAHRMERQVRQDLEGIAGLQLLPSYDAVLSATIHDRHSKLSYVDAATIAVAIRTGEPLLTFDETQKKAFQAERRAAS
ncbi:MAG: PIN domain-containing protein [Candidatus Thermoplasmatota archaeon]